ncbi:MAG TPA: hypothetical protein VK760_12440 [Candidatus Acidoferrales bacterium]|jgi:hypothetical protein|nr:hypothetical protein [Candidatus Acidoferrales bacterium]
MTKYYCALFAVLVALAPVAGTGRGFGGGFGGRSFSGRAGGYNFSRDNFTQHHSFNGNTFDGNRNTFDNHDNDQNNWNRYHENDNGNYDRYGNRTNVNVHNNTVVRNPVYVNNTDWGWNHGVAWYPSYGYWGGGFWGAFGIGVASAAVGAAVYGSIVANSVTYTSYQVQQSSPGATMLSNYQLTQVQCGPPDLVVIYGPQNSVICARPNNLVAAGTYNLNTKTLSLSST